MHFFFTYAVYYVQKGMNQGSEPSNPCISTVALKF